LAYWFFKRRAKCDKITDDGQRTTIDENNFGSGELQLHVHKLTCGIVERNVSLNCLTSNEFLLKLSEIG
jgi:hypothetical protein